MQPCGPPGFSAFLLGLLLACAPAADAARSLPVTLSLDGALGQADMTIDPKDCAAQPLQGTSHNGVRLPDLQVESELRSQRPRNSSDVTIITQCSFDRLQMLEAQCTSWGGIISLAMYWPVFVTHSGVSLNRTKQRDRLEAAKTHLAEFHSQLESEGRCRLDIVLLSERIRPDLLWAYPYNGLRNHAIMRATTDVLLLLDVDFVVSNGLHEKLATTDASAALLEDTVTHRQAIVLPAFETNPSLSIAEGRDAAMQAVQGKKEELLRMFRSRTLTQFAEFYPSGHQQTSYKRFFNSTTPYPIRYRAGYEPYILISRRLMPLYDERFRGYGFDKVMHIWQLHAQGFQLVAHPDAWVVHRPHPPSAGYHKAFTGPAYTSGHQGTPHLKHMETIATDMMDEIKAGTYPMAGISAIAACRDLPEQPDRLVKWW